MNHSLRMHRWSLDRNSSRTNRAARRKYKPLLEVLENYYLLSPFTVTNANNSGSGSLRAMIDSANSLSGASSISFDIGSVGSTHTINVTSQLPTITEPLTINGLTQGGNSYTGSPLIEIDGNSAGSVSGIVLSTGSTGSTIEGLSIVDFEDAGVFIGTGSNGDLIEGNYLGITPADASLGNHYGVYDQASSATIGGTATGAGNVISANYTDGIEVLGTDETYVAGTLIEGNLIGEYADETNDQYSGNGVGIYGEYVSGLTIGGKTGDAENVISCNHGDGVFLDHVRGPEVLYNTIDHNSGSGVYITHGSTTAGAINYNQIDDNEYGGIYINLSNMDISIYDNQITGNGSSGVAISAGDATVEGNPYSVFNANITGNSIAGNGHDAFYRGGDGIYVTGGVVTATILGNFDVGNDGDGIGIDGESDITIGGLTNADRNTLFYDDGDGIDIEGTENLSSGDLIENNDIGTDHKNDGEGNFLDNIYADYTSGLEIFGNKIVDAFLGDGIDIHHSVSPTIGGTANWQGNIIEYNDYGGMFLENVDGPSVIGNTIDYNSYFEEEYDDYGGISCQSLSSSPAVFSDNSIIDNYGAGIYIANSYVNLTIECNDIEDNAGPGVGITTYFGTTSAISVAIDDNRITTNEFAGIYVSGGLVTLSIQANTVESNDDDGIDIYGESNATIGGTIASEGNIIAGNEGDGIYIDGYPYEDVVNGSVNPNDVDTSYDDLIANNFIGVVNANCTFGPGVTGVTSNEGDGIDVQYTYELEIFGNTIAENDYGGIYIGESEYVEIGYSAIGFGNVIDDNGTEGIELYEVYDFEVDGNSIEYNSSSGIFASSVINYGGVAYNTISGNGGAGLYVFNSKLYLEIYSNDITGNSSSGIAISVSTKYDGGTMGAAIDGNSIFNNGADGIYVANGVITVNVDENDILANAGNGIEIDYESNATIGGTNLGDGNWIADNLDNGILIEGTFDTPSANDVIDHNTIGGSSSSSGNSKAGIWALYTANLKINSNLIAENSDSGIDLSFGQNTSASITGNTIQENGVDGIFVAVGHVGVKIEGNNIESNSSSGIGISQASQSVTAVSAKIHDNTISNNLADGIYVSSGIVDVSAMGNTIESNTLWGLTLLDEPSATIGGNCDGMGNTIESNGDDGIYLGDSTVMPGDLIQNNTIEFNTDAGIDINSSNNTIGGTGSYESNTILTNGTAGVGLGQNGPATGNLISGNSIYGNMALGIDLNYGTPQAGIPLLNGSDIANNDGQNYPVIGSVAIVGSDTTGYFTLDSTASSSFSVEFFSDTTADASGYGQGETYLGSTTVMTDASGEVSSSIDLGDLPIGTIISATATNTTTDNTSEFAYDATVLPTTTTSLVGSDSTSTYGQVVTFTATVAFVSPGDTAPTGTVTFLDNGVSIGTGAVDDVSGVATLQISTLSVGMHSEITADYSGDANNLGSTSAPVSDDVSQAFTQTTLSSSANPSVFGQTVTFSATVSPVTPGGGTPTGSVEFLEGGEPVAAGTESSPGVWTWSITPGSVGPISNVSASFTGDASYGNSTSNEIDQQVNQASTHSNVISSASPSVHGQSVTFMATVQPLVPGAGTPTGTVTFFDNGDMIGTGMSLGMGVWTFSTDALTVNEPHVITDMYGGDPSFLGDTSLPLSQAVNQAGTSTSLISSANPSASGQTVKFTATVSATSPGAGTPTGGVTFQDGATPLGPGTLASPGVWTFTTTSLTVGLHPNIIATYNGDANFLTSTSPTLSQSVSQATTATTVTSSDNTSVYGELVTFTATVAVTGDGGGTPGGVVTFYNSGVPLGVGTPGDSGTWTFSTAALAVGTYSDITARYGGGTNFLSSTSAGIPQSVGQAGTATSVTSSSSTSVYGQSVTFTATVAVTGLGSGTPGGTVAFMIDGNQLGTGTLTGPGVWTYTTSALNVSNVTQAITANYSGSTNFLSSDSSALPQTVNQSDTLTTVTSPINPSVYGQTVALTATVAATGGGSGTPTGIVVFLDGGGQIGTGTLTSPGVWTFYTSSLAVTTHPYITALYNGDANFHASESDNYSQTVNEASSQTTLTSSVSSSVSGQPVTFTATVAAVAPGAGTPTGTVTFEDNGDPIGGGTQTSAGVWTFTTTSLSVGSHPDITADYSGDGGFTGSDSSDYSQTVTRANSQTIVSTSVNPTVYTQSVTFTATVAALAPATGTPTGTVDFYDNTSLLGPGTLSSPGVWTFSTTSLAIGSHPTITAAYLGDGNFLTSTSPSISQLVNQESSQTTVTSSTNPSILGQSVTFTATVAAVAPGVGTPTGSVNFFNGSALLGTGTPASPGVWTFATTTLGLGSHANITAVYGGDADFQSSVAPTVTQTVTQASAQTTVTSSLSPSVYGQSVTFTATLSPVAPAVTTPTGGVTFFDGSVQLGSGTLASPGVWTLTTSGLAGGPHPNITAVYSGDDEFQGNTSPAFSQTVNKASSQSSIAASPNPSNAGGSVTFTATVTAVSPGSGIPTGTVTFQDGSTIIGTATLAGGVATFTDSSLSAGTHSISFTFGGNGNFQASTSSAVSQVVQGSAPAIALAVVTSNLGLIAPDEVNGPTVAFVERFGSHKQATSLVISFDDALDANSAQTLSNYSLVGSASKHARGTHKINIGSAVYNEAANTVTLTLSQRSKVFSNWMLTINGTSATGVKNTSGVMLDGAGDGHGGSNYVGTIATNNLVGSRGSVPKAIHARVKELFQNVHMGLRKGR